MTLACLLSDTGYMRNPNDNKSRTTDVTIHTHTHRPVPMSTCVCPVEPVPMVANDYLIDDTLMAVFQKLDDGDDIHRCRLVCRRWNAMISESLQVRRVLRRRCRHCVNIRLCRGAMSSTMAERSVRTSSTFRTLNTGRTSSAVRNFACTEGRRISGGAEVGRVWRATTVGLLRSRFRT
jgi:hypothetical protein